MPQDISHFLSLFLTDIKTSDSMQQVHNCAYTDENKLVTGKWVQHKITPGTLSVLQFSQQPFIRSTSHLAGCIAEDQRKCSVECKLLRFTGQIYEYCIVYTLCSY